MDRVIEAIVEIPMGTKNKYEIDKARNRIKLDRVLYSQMTYPAEYGYIEHTLAEDNDPLDILIIASTKTFPGCIVDARVIGALDMIDNDEKDHKIIAVMHKDPRFSHIHKMADIQEHMLREIKHFFRTYKDLQEFKKVEVYDFHDKAYAEQLIDQSIKRYQTQTKGEN